MRRHLRHILPSLSLAVAMLIGTWLAMPHDVCLTKLIAASGCVCLPDAASDNGCGCCAQKSAGDIACNGSGHGSSADQDQSKSTHSPGCFSISSEFSRMTGPERAPAVAPVFAVVAMVPLIIDSVTVGHSIEFHEISDNLGLNRSSLHRDNCVYLI